MTTAAPSTDWYVDHLLADAERVATVLDGSDLGSPVPSCGDWDLAALAAHLGWVHRWARRCIAEGRPPTDDETRAIEPLDRERPADWMRTGAAALADTLRGIDPDGSTWHPFPVERVGRVWPRRMAHETVIHRWDAERAVGEPGPIDAELASDGIDEYLELVVPRRVRRDGIELPTGSLHLHCTDVPGEWLVSSDPDDGYRLVRAHQKGDAALRGPAGPMLLRLWARTGGLGDELSGVGDEGVLDAWLSIAGM